LNIRYGRKFKRNKTKGEENIAENTSKYMLDGMEVKINRSEPRGHIPIVPLVAN
jgi:hypothetical protein